MHKIAALLFSAIIVLFLAFFYYPASSGIEISEPAAYVPLEEKAAPSPVMKYGMAVDSFNILEGRIGKNENLAGILQAFDVSYNLIHKIAEKSREVFDVKKLKAGNPYKIFCSKDDPKKLQCFIYEKNPVEYVVYDIRDSIAVYKGKKKVETHLATASGIIHSSLYETMVQSGIDPNMAMALSEIYAWQIDFFRIQKGDRFKLIFEEKFVDGQKIGYGKILAAQFSHYGENFYAFYFDKGVDYSNHEFIAYFDENGESLQKAFLKAPLKYKAITSNYNLKRFHPVLKKVKPHLGTDYAAPTGTPIYAVGDGLITEAGYTSGNGKYVKIRHNKEYTTGYLHMSKIAKGIKPGTYVKQKDIIGYVGSTGLATGPHLCFRFYKNGKQVDPFKVKMPPSRPVDEQYRAGYMEMKEILRTELEKIKFEEEELPHIASAGQL